MALPDPVEREPLHARNFEFRGFRRADGLFDIEGRMTDTKTYSFPNEWRGEVRAGEPVHDMRIRLTLDRDFVVRDIAAETAAGPYRMCGDIAPAFAVVKGMRVAPGWRNRLREKLGGVRGCTHLVEMLGAMATVAYQTIYPVRDREGWNAKGENDGPPAILDTCHALARDGEVVKRFWPKFYTGPDA